jgi:hypothetical protein
MNIKCFTLDLRWEAHSGVHVKQQRATRNTLDLRFTVRDGVQKHLTSVYVAHNMSACLSVLVTSCIVTCHEQYSCEWECSGQNTSCKFHHRSSFFCFKYVQMIISASIVYIVYMVRHGQSSPFKLHTLILPFWNYSLVSADFVIYAVELVSVFFFCHTIQMTASG